MIKGTFTALITPFRDGGIDNRGIEQLVDFQVKNGISGILAVGTTGESPVLSWEEHNAVIEKVARECGKRCICIAGTGSNNTREALEGTVHAYKAGAEAALLVDPYYNGPSSLEIRNEYVAPIARAVPEMQIIPYVIPGRTGAQLLPEDLALLHQSHPNVATVKEATGNLDNMRRTRACCGSEYAILSGDDGITFDMVTDPGIQADGVISVASNIVPGPVVEMVRCLKAGEMEKARELNMALAPLWNLVTVKTTEQTPFGEVMCRARNPLAIKTLMAVLGIPAGGCRQPLGKLTRNALDKVLEAARTVLANNPEILQPVAEHFGVDLAERLNATDLYESYCYDGYA
jgi:4-hydroxy-tetrahydrodipicolinate synthase